MGSLREDLFPGCRCLPVGEHLLFYRVSDVEITISRVLHRRQDLHSYYIEHRLTSAEGESSIETFFDERLCGPSHLRIVHGQL